MRWPKSEWGIKVKIFTQRYGITLKDLAAASDVNYNTLLTTMVGKTTGEKASITEKVDAFIAEHITKNPHPPGAMAKPFEEVTPCKQSEAEPPNDTPQ